ncbi:MAG: hypothetical protein KDA05_00220, partial [Phycisphaerales bacterium]|nr:hypothetical protein [Phycisphaerales bacterium]
MTTPAPDHAATAIDPLVMLRDRFARAIRAAAASLSIPLPDESPDPRLEASKRADLGDFQCNAAMALAKGAGKNPRDVAQAIVAAANSPEIGIEDLAEPINAKSIAGPGFINIRLRADLL